MKIGGKYPNEDGSGQVCDKMKYVGKKDRKQSLAAGIQNHSEKVPIRTCWKLDG